MNPLVFVSAALCAAALVYLLVVIQRRYPMQRSDPGPWSAPQATSRWVGREPGFERIVDRIEKARTNRADWEALLDQLDAIADELDPTPQPGLRRVVPYRRRGLRFWTSLDQWGAPRSFDRHYLDARLTAIERAGGTTNGR